MIDPTGDNRIEAALVADMRASRVLTEVSWDIQYPARLTALADDYNAWADGWSVANIRQSLADPSSIPDDYRVTLDRMADEVPTRFGELAVYREIYLQVVAYLDRRVGRGDLVRLDDGSYCPPAGGMPATALDIVERAYQAAERNR